MTMRLFLIVALFSALTAQAQPSPTVASSSVGHGGGIAREYLKTSRAKASVTARKILEEAKKNPGIFDELCRFQDTSRKVPLAEELVLRCAAFAAVAVPQMLKMTTVEPIIDFKLKSEDLLDFEGNIADAICTDCKITTPVIFDARRVKTWTPYMSVYIWFHEMGHKVLFEGKYVDDHLPIAGFARGHDLLDTLARGMANFALDREIIWQEFNLLDYFECETFREGEERSISRLEGASLRVFDPYGDKKNIDDYKAGFDGENPYYRTSIADPDYKGANLVLKLAIRETNGCRDVPGTRWTRLTVSRDFGDGRFDTLDQASEPRNLLCEQEKNKPISVTWGQFTFACKYSESVGTAIQPLPRAFRLLRNEQVTAATKKN